MIAGEPGDVAKTKLIEGLEVSLWDRWEMTGSITTTLQAVVEHIETTYEGLEVRDILKGNMPVYFHALMNAPGKEKERKKLLATSVFSATDCDNSDKYIDLNITCTRKQD
jgi:hypothetical protein